MAGNIKGITIEFQGDTTRLDKALRQINSETRSIDKELRQVDKALKFNPTSVELWRQKQQLLTQKVEETKTKLDTLKQAQAKMDAEGVDKNSAEYKKLQREIIVTENQVKNFEGQLKQVGNVSLRAASEQVKAVGNSLTAAGEKMKGLSMAAAAVVGSLAAISYKAGTNADDLNTLSKVYSINTTDLQKYKAAADLVDVSVDDIAKSHVKLEKTMYSAQNGSKTATAAFDKLGVSVTNSDGTLRSSEEVWQDTIEALGKMTNETERDALAQQLMGKSAANLNPLIEDQGETYKNLSNTLAKYDLDFVDQKTLDKANEFNDSLDTMKAIGSVAIMTVGSELAATLAPALEKIVDLVGKFAEWLGNLSPQVLTVIGIVATVIAVLSPVLLFLGKMAFAISSIMSLMATIGPAIAGVLATAGPIIAVIAAIIAVGVLLYKNWDKIKAKASEIWNHVKEVFGTLRDDITTIWNAIKTFLTNVVQTIVLAVTTRFTALKTKITTIWNNIKTAILTVWTNIKTRVTTAVNAVKEKVSTVFSNLKTKVATIWQGIKEKITGPIQKAKETVKGVVDKIKDFFPINVKNLLSNITLPHIKLPHFKLTGEFSLKNKTVPSLSVDWYKTGGIFSSPSIIGVGEAGSEAVVPLDRFWKTLEGMNAGETNINIVINGAGDPRAVAEEVKRMLIKETNQRRLAWQ